MVLPRDDWRASAAEQVTSGGTELTPQPQQPCRILGVMAKLAGDINRADKCMYQL